MYPGKYVMWRGKFYPVLPAGSTRRVERNSGRRRRYLALFERLPDYRGCMIQILYWYYVIFYNGCDIRGR